MKQVTLDKNLDKWVMKVNLEVENEDYDKGKKVNE